MPEPRTNPGASAPQPMKTVKLAEALYVTTGGAGANTGFFAGKDGVLAVDAKMTPEAGAEFAAQIRAVTAAPIRRMVLTHSDLDHVNGLSAFPKDMTITAHGATRRDMEQAFRDPKLEALNAWLPNEILEGSLEFTFGGAEVRVLHFGPAHTGGDAVVLFRKERLVYAGDLITFGRPPLIHLSKGGSVAGLLKNLNAMLALDADVFVPGHNDPCGKKDIQGLIRTVEQKLERVAVLVKQGRSLEEIKAELKVVERVLPNGTRFPSFEEAAFLEMTKGI